MQTHFRPINIFLFKFIIKLHNIKFDNSTTHIRHVFYININSDFTSIQFDIYLFRASERDQLVLQCIARAVWVVVRLVCGTDAVNGVQR